MTQTLSLQRPATAKPPRRRNADRSAATRERILLATVDCLYTLGYHQTTTVMVTERAKVSRGAMLHHFPSKAELLKATILFIRERMSAAHTAHLEPITDDRERYAALVDIIWGQFSQPIGVARIEIMLASRSDPDFGPYFTDLHAEFDQRHKEAVWPLAQRLGFTDRRLSDSLVMLYAAAVRGLAIDYLHPPLRADVEASVALLKQSVLTIVDAHQPPGR